MVRLQIFLFLILLLIVRMCTAQDTLLVIDDDLTDYSTVGHRHGGTFTGNGWKTQIYTDYIQYDVETISAGEIQFDLQGIYASHVVFPNIEYDEDGNPTTGEDVHYSFLSMWDRDDDHQWYGQYVAPGVQQWHNPYKCYMHIYGYVPGDIYKWRRMKLRLNVAAYNGGYDDDPHAFEDPPVGPFDWEQNHTYHHRLVWGHGHMRWYMDGEEIKHWDYSSFGVEYAPPFHSIRIGSGVGTKGMAGFQVPRQITFSNLQVWQFLDHMPPEVLSIEPDGSNVPLESDIIVRFSESMDPESVENAFSITPYVAGEYEWSGAVLYFNPSGLLEPATTYTVRIDTQATDAIGNNMLNEFEATFSTTSSMLPSEVEKYDVFEITRIATGIGGNKYKTVWLRGTFQGPSETIEIDGFWDSGDVWKVRMAPTEEGTWTYSITSNESQLEASGSFVCIPSTRKGFIRKSATYPYTFAYDDGTPWLWKGDTSWRGFTDLIPYEARWKPYIDLRASQGYTAVQSILVSFINGLGFWKNEGGLIFEESSTAKDYDRLRPQYFHWVDKRVRYALDHGIVPVIFFTWAQEWINFTQAQFERFERYIVARYAAYNVVWCISGEYDEAYGEFGTQPSEWEHHGQYVFDKDPYDHPITFHPTGRSTCAEFGNDNWLGLVMQQSPYWHRDIHRDRSYNKPVVNAEYGYAGKVDDINDVRIGAWEIITGGGYFTAGFLTTYAPDKGGWDLEAYPDAQNWLKFLNLFMDETKWWQMNPDDSKTSNGHLLCKPGEEYIAYSRNGGSVSVDLAGVNGTIPAQWLNPRMGSFSERFEVQGGGNVSFAPPFSGDWVLHVGEGVPTDTIPPNPPTDLTSPNQSEFSITLAWVEPTPTEDGDTAVRYNVKRDGELIATPTSTIYTDTGLQESESYFYEVFSVDDKNNESTTGTSGTFSTKSDSEPPQLVSVDVISATELNVTFSEPVDPQSAEVASHYSILQGVPVLNATMGQSPCEVELTTEEHPSDKCYTLFVNHVCDEAANPNPIVACSRGSYRLGAALMVGNLSPANYELAWLNEGDEYYIDRNYIITRIPQAYTGYLWIKTANDDKLATNYPFLTFDISQDATICLVFEDGRALPSWASGHWTDTGETIETSDKNLRIYEKNFTAGIVELGPNAGTTSNSMYVVIIKTEQISGDIVPPLAPVGSMAKW